MSDKPRIKFATNLHPPPKLGESELREIDAESTELVAAIEKRTAYLDGGSTSTAALQDQLDLLLVRLERLEGILDDEICRAEVREILVGLDA